MTKTLNQVDLCFLCFVIDTTGSMGGSIDAAKRHLLDAVAALRQSDNLDLQVGLVEYRDHPPQESSFVTRLYPLTRCYRDRGTMPRSGSCDRDDA